MDTETLAAVTLDFAACDTSGLHDVMEKYGFCVVTNVLTPDDVVLCHELFATDLRAIVDLDDAAFSFTELAKRMAVDGADVVAAWDLLSHPLGRTNPSVASDYGIPQGSAAWYVRSHPRVCSVFRRLLGVEELCVDMDCVLFDNLDPEIPEKDRLDDLSPRTDLCAELPISAEWQSYQGVVYITDADGDTSATVIWPRSHKDIFDSILAVDNASLGDGSQTTTSLPADVADRFKLEAGRVKLPRGSLLVWNSRTAHQCWNVGPRLAFPVSFAPKSWRSSDALADKREWVVRGNATTSCPLLGTLHPYSSLEPGSDPEFPLKSLAHLWAVDGSGAILPQIEALL
jgi:hypothetical protein